MIPERVRAVLPLLAELIERGGSVTNVVSASNQVPATGLSSRTRPGPYPSSQWRTQVRIRIDDSHVPSKQRRAFDATLARLDQHLSKNKIWKTGVGKRTPSGDLRFSILLPPNIQARDNPFVVLFAPTSDRSPGKRNHVSLRLAAFFEALKPLAQMSHTGTLGDPSELSVRISATPENQETVRKHLARLKHHLFEENDGRARYEHVRCVSRRSKKFEHELVFHFPNRAHAVSVMNAILPRGGYH